MDKWLIAAAYLARVVAFIAAVLVTAELIAAARNGQGRRFRRVLAFAFACVAASILYFLVGTLQVLAIDRHDLLRWSVFGWLPLDVGLWWLWWSLRPRRDDDG